MTTKYTAQQVAKELTPSVHISQSGKIFTSKGNTELHLVGKETIIVVSGWMEEGLVKTHIWYFTPENRDGDPTETHFKKLTAQQVADLYNYLIKIAPEHGYDVWNKEEETMIAEATGGRTAYEPEETEAHTDHIYNILTVMEEQRRATEKLEELLA